MLFNEVESLVIIEKKKKRCSVYSTLLSNPIVFLGFSLSSHYEVGTNHQSTLGVFEIVLQTVFTSLNKKVAWHHDYAVHLSPELKNQPPDTAL